LGREKNFFLKNFQNSLIKRYFSSEWRLETLLLQLFKKDIFFQRNWPKDSRKNCFEKSSILKVKIADFHSSNHLSFSKRKNIFRKIFESPSQEEK